MTIPVKVVKVFQGLRGPKGETTGIQGEKGDQGDPGPQGIQGDAGPAGADGVQGLQGIQGDKGDQGDPGPQGIQGDAGPAGADGAQGLQGIQGNQGDTGPAGADGSPDTAEQVRDKYESNADRNPFTDDDKAAALHANRSSLDNLSTKIQEITPAANAAVSFDSIAFGQVRVVVDGTHAFDFMDKPAAPEAGEAEDFWPRYIRIDNTANGDVTWPAYIANEAEPEFDLAALDPGIYLFGILLYSVSAEFCGVRKVG